MGKILLTGGLGYIGSHTAVELLHEGYEAVIVDNCSNSEPSVLERIKTITGKNPVLYKADVSDEAEVKRIFDENSISAVIHFAGFKSVSQSVKHPLDYYDNNINTTVTLIKEMMRHECRSIIFSSSATVYGDGKPPYFENAPTNMDEISNPYGKTKLMNEHIIQDSTSAFGLSSVLLRYFNPIGAHESGLLGERPKDTPTNLLPLLLQAVGGDKENLTIFGDDYPTPDGTCIRDYIHVVDLAKGHVKALKWMEQNPNAGRASGRMEVFNLGTGKGTSVLELIRSFERATGERVPYIIGSRRAGDLPVSYAGVDKARDMLGWKAEKSLDEACFDAWRSYHVRK